MHPTTTGSIAFSNLNAQIEHWRNSEKPADSTDKLQPIRQGRRGGLVYALTARAPMRLATQDFAEALALAQDWVQRQPDSAEAWLALAHTQANLHGFADARESLGKARAAGAAADRIEAATCGLQRATGKYQSALICAEKLAEERKNTNSLGNLAGVLGDLGRYEQASKAFERAWLAYREPSPFVSAWLALSEAKMWMSAGYPARAERLLAATIPRLPQHLGMRVEHAVSLSAMDKRKEAIAKLRPLLELTSDPDVPNLIAIWLKDTPEKAKPLATQAASGYTQRMQQFPHAYAAHAVEYWLGPGSNPQKALELAQLNLQPGATVQALALLATAAHVAGAEKTACDSAAAYLAVGEQTKAARRKGSTAADMKAIQKTCRA